MAACVDHALEHCHLGCRGRGRYTTGVADEYCETKICRHRGCRIFTITARAPDRRSGCRSSSTGTRDNAELSVLLANGMLAKDSPSRRLRLRLVAGELFAPSLRMVWARVTVVTAGRWLVVTRAASWCWVGLAEIRDPADISPRRRSRTFPRVVARLIIEDGAREGPLECRWKY